MMLFLEALLATAALIMISFWGLRTYARVTQTDLHFSFTAKEVFIVLVCLLAAGTSLVLLFQAIRPVT